MKNIKESLGYVLGDVSFPKEGLAPHYKTIIAELWHSYSDEIVNKLLNHQNNAVVCDGLMILSEIGSRGRAAIDIALNHVGHPDWAARFYLVDHLISCVDFLDENQISIALKLVSDESPDVRCKMMQLISRIDVSLLICSVELLDEGHSKDANIQGIGILKKDFFVLEDFEKIYSESVSALVVYAGAKLLNSWKSGICVDPIRVEISSYEISYLNSQLKNILSKHKK